MMQRLFVVGAVMILLPPCAAQVIVTARGWAERGSDVPMSITAVTEEDILDAGLDSIKDVARYVPNVLVTEFSSRRLSFPFIRGVGSGQGDPAVATFIDGVPQLQVSSTNLPLLDVERIEILRGPSGTLYGRNTLGGALSITTKIPSNTLKYGADVTLGNFDLKDYQFSFSTPIQKDRLYFSASGLYSSRDGYTKNDFTGHDVDFRDSWFGRSQMLWLPDAANEVRLTVYGEHSHDGGFVLSDLQGLRERPNRIDQDYEGKVDRDLISTTLTWDHHGECCEVKSISAVQHWEIQETSDFDFSTIDGIRRDTNAHQTYFSQEVRCSSPGDEGLKVSDNSRLKWLFGASGFYSKSSDTASNDYRPGGAGILFPPAQVGLDRARGDFDSNSVALFGQTTLTIDDQWDLTAALRYEYESRNADIHRTFTSGSMTIPTSASGPSVTFDEWLPRASIGYRWTEDVMSYVLVARGFKAGGFNLTAPLGDETFRPEKTWSYEVGSRASFCDDRVNVSAAWFYINWDDMQLSQFDAMSGGYVVNAGKSDSTGAEVEVTTKPIDEVEVFGGIGVLDTEFKRFTDQFGQDVSNESLPFAPDWTANVGSQLKMDLCEDVHLFARAEYFYVGTFYYDAGNRAGENYDLANFRIGCGNENWRVDLWLNNAFDENYVPVAFQPNPADPNQFVGESAAPRTYGFTVRLTF